ncbi:gluconate 2-dehydrogenase subunit 3 family protein [Mycobacterium sp. SMC-4]|uniref:gluconate 2-dehydrogenase subunit 3 family protein n=1 Tax=Mycobacterium sp. SMC-4 TaxID=2857059 RepID=UPI003CFE89E5
MTQEDALVSAPLGAPSLGEDRPDQPYFESARPRLGGLIAPVAFGELESAVIKALADTMIPAEGGFPAASEVGIVDFFGRYTTPTGFRAKHFPYLEEDKLKAALARLGDGFVNADTDARTQAVLRLEKDEEEFFAQVRSLVYYGYYSANEVTTAIAQHIEAGRDYHGPPLPYGYLHCIEDWDEAALSTAGQGSGYIATEDVVRVDLSKLTWLNGTTNEEHK